MTSFADLGLPAALLERVSALGYETPTDIQSDAIPALLAGSDVVGVAQTGTGKTAAFGLPLLASLNTDSPLTQGLVLAPTRELAMQVADAIEEMSPGGTRVLAIYGGSAYGPQLAGLRNGAHVVVGTPGRVIDMLGRGSLDLSELGFLVLDEADEMLRMGFADDVDEILASANPARQTALFSATMPQAIRAVARTHMNNPVEIASSKVSSTTETITQEYAVVPFRHKAGSLSRVLATSDAEAAIVFVRTRKDADEIGAELIANGVNAASISGDVPQKERERIVERLRSGSLNVLIATDVAARGLDVERIGLVVNFDVPREAEAYVHRIGRTGRAGRQGRALTFFTPKEQSRLRTIERLTGSRLTEIEIPTPRQVSEVRSAKALATITERIGRGRLDMYLAQLTKFAEDTDTELIQIAAALLATSVGDNGPMPREEREERFERRDSREDTFNARFDGPQGRRERGSYGDRDSDRGFRRGGDRDRRDEGFTTYRIEVGHKHGVRPAGIVGAIANEGGLRGAELGKIKIFGSFATVDIATPLTNDQMRRLQQAEVGGNQLRIALDDGPRGGYADSRGGFDSDRRPGGSRGSYGGKKTYRRDGDAGYSPRQYSRPTKRA